MRRNAGWIIVGLLTAGLFVLAIMLYQQPEPLGKEIPTMNRIVARQTLYHAQHDRYAATASELGFAGDTPSMRVFAKGQAFLLWKERGRSRSPLVVLVDAEDGVVHCQLGETPQCEGARLLATDLPTAKRQP